MTKRGRRRATVVATSLAVFLLTACGGNGEAAPGPSETVDPELAGLSEADLLVAPYVEEAQGKRTNPGPQGEFALPGQTVRIESLTTLETALDPQTGEEVRAPEGERFVVIEISHALDDRYQYTPPTVEVLLEDDDTRTNVVSSLEDATSFLVTVGDGAELVLAVEGHDVSAALPSGERIADPMTDVLRDPATRQDLVQPLTFDSDTVKHVNGTATSEYSTTVDTVHLTPYLPAELAGGAGRWVTEGNVFVFVEVSGTAASQNLSTEWGVVKTVQRWTADTDDESYASLVDAVLGGGAEENRTAVIETPASARELSLTVTANTVAEVHGDGGGRRNLQHGSRSFDVALGSRGGA